MPDPTEAPAAPINPLTQAAAVPQPPAQPPAKADDTNRPPWGDAENFDADKAWKLIQNLRQERSGGADVKNELDAIKRGQQEQREAIAAALGIKPEETSDTAKLAAELNALKEQVTASTRRAQLLEIASQNEIPAQYHHLLTATDTEGLKSQAASIAELVKANAAAAATPSFQPNPGQGQGNQPLTPEAQALAEYEQFYPSTTSK